MKRLALLAAMAASASPALAQSTSPNSSFLTRELNRAPATAPTAAPGTVTTRPLGQPAQTAPAPAPTTASPSSTPRPVAPPPASSSSGPQPSAARPATAPGAAPPAAVRPVSPSAATTAPTAEPPAAATEPPPPPPPTVLNAAAIAALPFRVDLPAGVQITTGRPGPNFNIWSIRKGDQTLAMVYAGPASQFPIYDGQQATVGDRTSIVVTEDNRRMALEHLFQRTTAPLEIHVWVASVDGADRILAEQIAQTVDPK